MATSSAAADAAQEDRRAEERAVLAERLRRSLATVVEDNNDLRVSCRTWRASAPGALRGPGRSPPAAGAFAVPAGILALRGSPLSCGSGMLEQPAAALLQGQTGVRGPTSHAAPSAAAGGRKLRQGRPLGTRACGKGLCVWVGRGGGTASAGCANALMPPMPASGTHRANGWSIRGLPVPAQEYNATLKKSQSQLLERTTELSELVDRLRGELSNAAAANARLKRDLADTKQALERVSSARWAGAAGCGELWLHHWGGPLVNAGVLLTPQQETAQAGSLSSELNAYRETEGAIATALAAVTAKGSGGASPGADGSAPVGEDGVPAWLEAEARAGGEARARSLKLQVLALRQALFRVARKAVSRGADSAQVADYISEAVDGGDAAAAAAAAAAELGGAAAAAAAPSPGSLTTSAAATAAGGDSAGGDTAVQPAIASEGGAAQAAAGRLAAAAVSGERTAAKARAGDPTPRSALAPAAADGQGAAAGRAEEREEEEVVEEEEEEEASGDDGDVVMPPAPIDVVHATVEDEDTPKTQTPLSDQGDASTNAAVGLLGMVLAPPIVLADALAAVSEAFFGAEEDEEGFEED
ncbi:unnamed protein product [Symbiodinium sp. KB8]|nr:unnamed protein product [Symbiodinium sp. KB8]